VRTLRDAFAPGSYLVLSHGTDEGTPEVARAVQNVYNRGGRTRRPRYRMIRTGTAGNLVGVGRKSPGQ
jgi:hypothetical protein